jgi:hypothetical protein
MTPGEIIKHCRERGISVAEFLKIPKLPKEQAIAAYINEEITEGRLAYHLGCDRLEARRIVQEFIAFSEEGSERKSVEGEK